MLKLDNMDKKYSCTICKKDYIRKSSLDKHKILCDFRLKTDRERNIELQESSDVPNHYELVKIVQELAFKNSRLEMKIEEMQKWVDKKKKKLNVITWLNTNVNSTIGFKEWIVTLIEVKEVHLEYLMMHKLYETMQKILEYNLPEDSVEFIYPIKCFTQKANMFYISDKTEDGSSIWRQMTNEDFAYLLNIINNKMMACLIKWKQDNKEKMEDSDKMCETFNKAIIKWMDISYTPDTTFNRMKSGLYSYLKKDLNNVMIEYEFEF